jgi:hypothetical protein
MNEPPVPPLAEPAVLDEPPVGAWPAVPLPPVALVPAVGDALPPLLPLPPPAVLEVPA